jgi:hypothetical protein
MSLSLATLVGQAEALRVAITLQPKDDRSVELAVEHPADEREPMRVDVCVVVSPQDFELESPNPDKPEPNRFDLTFP